MSPRLAFSGTVDATKSSATPTGQTTPMRVRGIDSEGSVGTAEVPVINKTGVPPPPPPPPPTGAPINDILPTVSGVAKVGIVLTGAKGTWREPTTPDPSLTPPVNTDIPSITGTTTVGQTLTRATGTWTGNPTPTFATQWESCDVNGANCADIAAATGSTYLLVTGDSVKTLRVRVVGTSSQGTATSRSLQTALVGGGGNPPPGSWDIVIRSVSDFSKLRGISGKRVLIEAGNYNITGQIFDNVIGANNEIWGQVGSVTSLKTLNGQPVGSLSCPTKIFSSSQKIIDKTGANNKFFWLDMSGPSGPNSPDRQVGSVLGNLGPNNIVDHCKLHHVNNHAGGNAEGGLLVKFSEIHNCGSTEWTGTSAGGWKCTDIATFEYCYLHNNEGNGVWRDVYPSLFIARYNYSTYNGKGGVRFELGHQAAANGWCNDTSDSEAYGNYCEFNNRWNHTEGGGIVINSDNGINVYNNTTNSNNGNGIKIKGSRCPTTNNKEWNNTLLGGDQKIGPWVKGP